MMATLNANKRSAILHLSEGNATLSKSSMPSIHTSNNWVRVSLYTPTDL